MEGSLKVLDSNARVEEKVQLTISSSHIISKLIIVGKIISKKILNKNTIKDMVRKSRNVDEDLIIADLSPNFFIFTFLNFGKAKEVLLKSPWNVMGYLLNIAI